MAVQEKKIRKKKKLGSYPYISVVLSISLALFVIGLFGMLLLYTHNLTSYIQENVEIQVYLNKHVTQTERIRIRKTLGEQPYVLQSQGQPSIGYVSKEEAAQKFIKDTGEDFMKFLGENPLRDAFVVHINSDYHTSKQLQLIKQQLESMSGVFEVVYTESLIQSINQNITKLSLILLSIAMLLLITVIILINNTIKLALFSQRFLVRSMQLVGATRGFIQWPFLKRSLWHGFLSGIIATGALLGVMEYGNRKIEGLHTLQNTEQMAILFAIVIVLGMIIAFLSTYRAIQKYIGMSLDELY